MKKASMLKHWAELESDQPLKPEPVPYKHKGSTYAQDGIRITGSREWIDSVLSRIQDLLTHENASTRLQVNYQESKDKETGHPLNSYNCYIQVHQRGREARIMHRIMGGM